MKKLFAVMLIAVMCLGVFYVNAETLAGGWSISESIEITDELKAIFDRALNSLLDVNYEPLAYLGCQTAAGANHCFLCSATVVYPGAQSGYVLIYIYEDLDGNAEISSIVDFDLGQLSLSAME